MSAKRKTFESLGLRPWLCKQVDKLGMKSPTPIQENCIPEIVSLFNYSLNQNFHIFSYFLSSLDVIALAQLKLDQEKRLPLHFPS